MSDIQVWTCALCGCRSLDIPHHLRLFHSDIDAEPDVWADGRHVVIDTTLSPEEFL